MRIALVCSDRGPCPPVRGGAIQLLIAKVAPLLAKTHEVTVFSITDPELPDQETSGEVRYERYPKEWFFETVCNRIEETNFDVIHVYNRPAWIPVLRKIDPEAVVILSMHNTVQQMSNGSVAQEVAGFRETDWILTVSRFVSDNTVKKFPQTKDKIQVVYTGADLSEYAPVWTPKGRQWRREIRKKFDIGDKDPVLLFVGRLVPYKGCHVILRALKRIVKQHKNAKLLVVGSKWYADDEISPYMQMLHNQADEMPGSVIFTSYVPVADISKYYAAADLFICASQWLEPLARVHYEAMATGLPIITTQRGGNSEVIVNGWNGLVIRDYKNPDWFAKAALGLLSNPALSRKMGKRGRGLAEKIYNFERVAADLESIYTRLTHSKREGRQTNGDPNR